MNFRPLLLGLTLLLAGCATQQDLTVQTQSSSSETMMTSSSVVSSVRTTSSSSKQSSKHRVSDNTHSFFVVLSTGKNKDGANVTARDEGAWVLPTNLTTSLVPDLYAVVLGPFDSEKEAKMVLESWPPKNPEAYVKDAGALLMPEGLDSLSKQLPLPVLVAIDGRLSLKENLTVTKEHFEEGGSFCLHLGPSTLVRVFRNGKQLEERMTPTEIDIMKRFTQDPEYSSNRYVNFWISDTTGEVVVPHLCLD